MYRIYYYCIFIYAYCINTARCGGLTVPTYYNGALRFFFSQLSYNGPEICFLTISTINSDHRNY